MNEKSIELSAIVRTKNSQETIYDTLESLKYLNEIIVVDEHSCDDTIEIAKVYKAKIIYSNSNELKSALKQALDEAKNNWIIMVNEGEIIPRNLLHQIKDYIKLPKKNRYALLLSSKTFYAKREIKAARNNNELRVFKAGVCEFCENSLKLKIKQGKAVSLNKNFKIQNGYILKYIKNNIFDEIYNTKNEDCQNKSSIILKPIFCFIYWYFIKKAFLDGKQGYIFSLVKFFDELKAQTIIYERERNKNDI